MLFARVSGSAEPWLVISNELPLAMRTAELCWALLSHSVEIALASLAIRRASAAAAFAAVLAKPAASCPASRWCSAAICWYSPRLMARLEW